MEQQFALIRKHLAVLSTAANKEVTSLALNPLGRILLAIALVIVVLRVIKVVYGILNFIYVYFLRPGKNLKFYGSWAVVTGASDGIGKAYCEELARKGLNIILVSRTQSKLDDCATEIKTKYKVQTKTCAVDLTHPNDATLAKISATISGLDVGILVNNAGSSYGHPEFIEQMSREEDIDLIHINTITPTLLAKLVLPGMKERGRGVIINIGSANGLLPAVPLLSTYAGTKAYVDQFTRSLDLECRKFGVRVQNMPPFFVATKMSKIRRARLDAPTPNVWAKAAVKQIGFDTTITPFWFHGIMLAAINAVPRYFVAQYVLNLHLGFRKAFYRKQARLQAEAAKSGSGEKKDK